MIHLSCDELDAAVDGGVVWRHLLGTPDTSLSGRSTRKARSAFTSSTFVFSDDNISLTKLKARADTQ